MRCNWLPNTQKYNPGFPAVPLYAVTSRIYAKFDIRSQNFLLRYNSDFNLSL